MDLPVLYFFHLSYTYSIVICISRGYLYIYFISIFSQVEADPLSQTSVHLSWQLMEGQNNANYYVVRYREVMLADNTAQESFVRR